LALGPYRERSANLLAGQQPQEKGWHGEGGVDPVMLITVPVHTCNYRKDEIGAEIEESQPVQAHETFPLRNFVQMHCSPV
jgi:hypothetical protein